MPQITEHDFSDPSTVVSILNEGLHGGFIDKGSLSDEEIHFCKVTDWIESVQKFKCSSCGKWHTAPHGEEKCLRTREPVEPRTAKTGFRVTAGSQLDLEISDDYSLYIYEYSSSVDTTKLPYKSIVFTPDLDEMVFSDRAGSTVLLPLSELPTFVDESSRENIISDINQKRKRLIDWESLDSGGDDFEEIIFRLVKRDDNYFNESWGGSGPDQGKDGFCSIDLGGRETRVLVQAKFNNNGDAVNDRQLDKSCRKADRHDCSGVIIGAVKTSGDLESEVERGTYQTQKVHYLRIWPGPEIKEKLSEHPDLIAEYFLD
ncbi:hypothetical protein [Natronobacterium texcoconense]|uniref:Restriction endonuclease n=1 Tax=Natronobacterium texcoconense TaxID=1095778 RepID=A0A1H1AMD3_NATTX|nr:hypothetical protein [Natronobacterium texcoconense]SDQ40817.1 hypothetical protein SAMN04489842_0743 [Natronobacterium texcoconense]